MLRRFVVWVFDFFLLIICHLRAQLCLELLAIFKISSFYFMVYAKPYGLLVIKVGQCQQPERQWNRLSSGRRTWLRGCIFYSLFIGTSWFDLTHTHTLNSCTLHGNMSDVLEGSLILWFVLSTYLHLLPFWISVVLRIVKTLCLQVFTFYLQTMIGVSLRVLIVPATVVRLTRAAPTLATGGRLFSPDLFFLQIQ